ncbi:MAG: hypothetical protein OXG60_14145 [Chloroflexi bacterium]|nr:hypothetical protein [Chloroflexota bacterium]
MPKKIRHFGSAVFGSLSLGEVETARPRRRLELVVGFCLRNSLMMKATSTLSGLMNRHPRERNEFVVFCGRDRIFRRLRAEPLQSKCTWLCFRAWTWTKPKDLARLYDFNSIAQLQFRTNKNSPQLARAPHAIAAGLGFSRVKTKAI